MYALFRAILLCGAPQSRQVRLRNLSCTNAVPASQTSRPVGCAAERRMTWQLAVWDCEPGRKVRQVVWRVALFVPHRTDPHLGSTPAPGVPALVCPSHAYRPNHVHVRYRDSSLLRGSVPRLPVGQDLPDLRPVQADRDHRPRPRGVQGGRRCCCCGCQRGPTGLGGY